MPRPHAELAALLEPELRAALSRQSLRLSTRVRGLTHGAHRSRRVAAGDEFLDHRAYVPGDDLRRLDWRAAARRDRWVLRRTRAEGNHDLCLLIDDGLNMNYGSTRSKSAATAQLAAALAWIAAGHHDRVGFGLSSGDEELQLQPDGRAETLRTLARRLSREQGSTESNWAELIERTRVQLRAPAVLVLISDWLDPFADDETRERAWQHLAELSASGHRVVLLQVLHGDELDFPWNDEAVTRFVDPQGRAPTREGPGRQMRQAYLERLRAHLDEVQGRCEDAGVLRQLVRADEPLVPSVLALLSALAQGVAISPASTSGEAAR